MLNNSVAINLSNFELYNNWLYKLSSNQLYTNIQGKVFKICFEQLFKYGGPSKLYQRVKQSVLINDETMLANLQKIDFVFIDHHPDNFLYLMIMKDNMNYYCIEIITMKLTRFTYDSKSNLVKRNAESDKYTFFTKKNILIKKGRKTSNLYNLLSETILQYHGEQFHSVIFDSINSELKDNTNDNHRKLLNKCKQANILFTSSKQNVVDNIFSKPTERSHYSTQQSLTSDYNSILQKISNDEKTIEGYDLMHELTSNKREFLCSKEVFASSNTDLMKDITKYPSANQSKYCRVKVNEEYNVNSGNLIAPEKNKIYSIAGYNKLVLGTAEFVNKNLTPSMIGMSEERNNNNVLLRGLNYASDASIGIDIIKDSTKFTNDEINIGMITSDIDQLTMFVTGVDRKLLDDNYLCKYKEKFGIHIDTPEKCIVQLFIDQNLFTVDDLQVGLDVGLTNIKPLTDANGRLPTLVSNEMLLRISLLHS